MMLTDTEITTRNEKGMIRPFYTEQRNEINGHKVISFGLSSYGYDIRLGCEFKIFHNAYGSEIDPKNFNPRSFVDVNAEDDGYVTIPPNSFVLGRSYEYIKVPRDILVLCIGKSTYARCGIIANVTPLEPEWEGNITIEISNTTPLPARVYAYEGIVQLVFLKANTVCSRSYADKLGKYQRQTGVTLPTV